MLNNDVLQKIRYLLNVNELKLIEIVEGAGYLVTPSEMSSYLLNENDLNFEPCPDLVMDYFLNGLIIYKRGPREGQMSSVSTSITNNTILKKLRVAFELKDIDLIDLIEKPGHLKISKAELGAFFRKEDHRNYRECGDQFLRNILNGLISRNESTAVRPNNVMRQNGK